MNEALILFTSVTFLNVVVSTIKSLVTIKGKPFAASIVSAISYGINTYSVFYTALDGIELWVKAVIVMCANLIGVWLVKLVEEKLSKDREWVYCCTFKEQKQVIENLKDRLKRRNINCLYNMITDNLAEVKIFAESKEASAIVKNELEFYDCKYHIVEAI